MHWVIDGNNVMGAGADGWWNDPVAAAARLTQAIATWSTGAAAGEQITVVFDGRPEPRLAGLAGGDLAVDFARRLGRDAADDRIVELVAERFVDEPAITVVTSDRGLAARLPPGVTVEGAGRYRARLGLVPPGGRAGRDGRGRRGRR